MTLALGLIIYGTASAQPTANEPPGFEAGQSAFRKAEGIPQPHYQEAQRLAHQENFWKVPVLNMCQREDSGLSEQIYKDPPATRVTDNLYFIGTGVVSAWALDTPAGIVVIDSLNNPKEAEQFIIGGLRALDADPARIKAVIVSHGHGDHFGGAEELRDRYGASIYMSELDNQFAKKQLPKPNQGPVPKVDVLVKDGDALTLGGVTIRMFLTPGHTPGTLSLLIPTLLNGVPQTVVFHGGVTSSNGLTPALHAAYDSSIDQLIAAAQAAHATGYMANHGAFDDIAMKVAHIRGYPKDPSPFLVGEASTLRWLKIAKECNLNNADVDKVFAARGEKVGPDGH
jgi:metallo-beta-lactamase class B